MNKSQLKVALDLLKKVKNQRTGDTSNSAVKKLDSAIRRIEKAIKNGDGERITAKEILLAINLALLTVDKFAVFVKNVIEFFSR